MFTKFNFSKKQINDYLLAAKNDLRLANSKEPEIKFLFSYNCLLKIAQAVCAHNNLRVKSHSGHHIALLDKCANLLDEPDLAVVAQAMRDKRNRDLYDGGTVITEKEANTYYTFVKNYFKAVDSYILKK